MRSVSALVAIAFVFVACGGSTSSGPDNGTPPPPPPGNGNADGGPPPVTTPDAGTIDAAPPDDETYPADHPPMPLMENNGGPVITDMKIVTVTFKGNTQKDALKAFDDAIVASDWWASVTRGYGINKGTSGDLWEQDDTVSGKTIDNDKDIKPWIQTMVDQGKLPPPDEKTLYALYYPQGTTIVLTDGSPGGPAQSCSGFQAYHDSAPVNVAGKSIDAVFAVMPDCGGGLEGSASHEFIEAATDPHPNSKLSKPTWYMWNDAWSPMGVLGGEVADQCERRGPFTTPDGHDVARSWVNAAAKESKDPCQPSDPGKVFFAAAIPSDKVHITVPQDHTSDHDSESYVLVKSGETRILDVTVFSEAKLPHDLTLVVGKARNNPDPSQIAAIASGIDAKLSVTTGHNGQHRTLTISAAATAAKGDHPFVVRAILEKDDYHSWPVILRVQ